MIKYEADPVLIIYFIPKAETVAAPKSTPFIPIYLSEKLTGLYVDTERRRLAISTDNIVWVKKDTKTQQKEYGKLEVQQKGETQTVEVSLIGKRDSIGLNLLLPLLQTIYDKVIAVEDYRIAYFHKNVLIFDARLSSLDINQSRENDLVAIDIGLEVSPLQEKETQEQQEPTLVAANPAQNVPVTAGA